MRETEKRQKKEAVVYPVEVTTEGSRNRKKLKPGSLVLLKTYGSMFILFC